MTVARRVGLTRRVARARRVARTVVRVMREEDVPFMAGSVAYNAFVSLLPLLLLAFLVASAVGTERLAGGVLDLAGRYLTPSAERVVVEGLSNATGKAGLSVVSAVTLLWGSLKLFRSLDTAFDELYDAAGEPSLWEKLREGAVVLVSVTFAVAATGLATLVFALFPWLPLVGVLNPLLLVVGLTVAFFPVYYVFPDAEVTAREVLPGTVLAAVGWATLQAVFQAYAAAASSYEVYGTAGAVLLLLTWLYFAGLVLLAGAVLNVVLAGRARPSPDAAEEDTEHAVPGG